LFYFFQIDSHLGFAKISSFSFIGKNIQKKQGVEEVVLVDLNFILNLDKSYA